MKYIIKFIDQNDKEVGSWNQERLPVKGKAIVLGGSQYRDNELFYKIGDIISKEYDTTEKFTLVKCRVLEL